QWPGRFRGLSPPLSVRDKSGRDAGADADFVARSGVTVRTCSTPPSGYFAADTPRPADAVWHCCVDSAPAHGDTAPRPRRSASAPHIRFLKRLRRAQTAAAALWHVLTDLQPAHSHPF